MTHNIRWSVSLNNGETHHEETGNFKTIEGELSPWQRLQNYISENNLQITSLSLKTKDGRCFNLPSAGKNPKFKAFANAEKPLSYTMFRQVGIDIHPKTKKEIGRDLYTVIEAEYPNYTLQLWVNEKTSNSWVLVKG